MTIDQILVLAAQHTQVGQTAAAEKLYWQILSWDPHQPEALFSLGVIALQGGVYDLAVDYIQKAIQLAPQVAQYHFQLAMAFRALDQWDVALTVVRQAHQLDPQDDTIAGLCCDCLKQQALVEMDRQQWAEALRCVQEALTLRQEAQLWFVAGLCSKLLGHWLDATRFWQQALRLDPFHADTYRELPLLYAQSVSSWHFPMMNDEIRNQAFQQALEKVVTPDSIVLDIGTGSGLLAMMAARAGSKGVFTCEENELIAAKAQEIIALNGYQEHIFVLPKNSSDVIIPIDLPEKADVVIAEVFGTGLTEELALPILAHARQHLLQPDGVLIPRGAALHLLLVQSSEIYGLHRIQSVSGFDLSPFNEFTNLSRGPWSGHLHHYDYQPLSAPQQVTRLNFRDHPYPFPETVVSIPVLETGEIHALCLWFDLQLDDEIVLTTHPQPLPLADPRDFRATCWGQRIQTLDYPIAVKTGDVFEVKVLMDQHMIFFSPHLNP